jgi:hypothetical protein
VHLIHNILTSELIVITLVVTVFTLSWVVAAQRLAAGRHAPRDSDDEAS